MQHEDAAFFAKRAGHQRPSTSGETNLAKERTKRHLCDHCGKPGNKKSLLEEEKGRSRDKCKPCFEQFVTFAHRLCIHFVLLFLRIWERENIPRLVCSLVHLSTLATSFGCSLQSNLFRPEPGLFKESELITLHSSFLE